MCVLCSEVSITSGLIATCVLKSCNLDVKVFWYLHLQKNLHYLVFLICTLAFSLHDSISKIYFLNILCSYIKRCSVLFSALLHSVSWNYWSFSDTFRRGTHIHTDTQAHTHTNKGKDIGSPACKQDASCCIVACKYHKMFQWPVCLLGPFFCSFFFFFLFEQTLLSFFALLTIESSFWEFLLAFYENTSHISLFPSMHISATGNTA